MENKMKYILAVIVLFSTNLISCSTKDKISAVNSSADRPLILKNWNEKSLKNGLRLITIYDPSLPRIAIGLGISVGSWQDPDGKSGLSHLTAQTLEQGTKTKSASQIANEFGQLGTDFSNITNYDFSVFSTSGLSQNRYELLSLFSDVILNPTFAPLEVGRQKSQAKSAIVQSLDQPEIVIDQIFKESLFPQHPYGNPILGNLKSVELIQASDLQNFYKNWYLPESAVLVVSGDFDPNFVKTVEEKFEKWQHNPNFVAEKSLIPPNIEKRTVRKIVTKQGLKQAQIRIGQIGIKRNDPDFLRLRLANLILGGAFASRLNQKIRDDLGLTYSISSSSDVKKRSGIFEISTFTRHEKTAETVEQTLKVIREFINDGITKEELASAKNLVISQFPMAIETTDKLGQQLINLRMYEISDNYLRNFKETVNEITTEQVNSAIRKRFDLEQLNIIIYADQELLKEQMEKLSKLDIR
jgi:zinc protease